MIYRILADTIALLHLLFVVFVVLGGLLAVRWPRASWIHAPAAIWGIWIELSGRICPLTPLENILRQKGGVLAYPEGFVDHYILPILYPAALGRGTQIALGAAAVVLNATVYTMVIFSARRRGRERRTSPRRFERGPRRDPL